MYSDIMDSVGFYGDYTAEIDGAVAEFGVHKYEDNCTEIEV